MRFIEDEINHWREYEKTKNKDVFDFSKNKEVESLFIKVVAKLSRCTNDNF